MNLTKFDIAEYLDDDEAIAEYLSQALETHDHTYIAHAIGSIARARGMTKVAKDSGLAREALYRALDENGNPQFSTILKVLKALGIKLKATAV